MPTPVWENRKIKLDKAFAALEEKNRKTSENFLKKGLIL